MKNTLAAELLAEFLGTMVLILFGNGVVAMVVLFDKGEYTNITLAWGLAVTMGIYIAGKNQRRAPQSRRHRRAGRVSRLPPGRKVLPYSLVQIAERSWRRRWFMPIYGPQFQKVDPTLERTAGVFHHVSRRCPDIAPWPACSIQTIGTRSCCS